MPPTTRPHIRPGARATRLYPAAVEFRDAAEGQPGRIVGHASVYNNWSEDLGGFKERVLPGAFDKSIGVSDVRALFNHDPNYIFGRTTIPEGSQGSLTLASEARGLHIESEPLDTPTIRDLVIAPMRAGLVTQMSFSFQVRGEELWDQPAGAGVGAVWRSPKTRDGLYERDLIDVELFDVSPVTFPAYTRTDVAVRSLLAARGLDLDALIACIDHAQRGLPLVDSQADTISRSIELLRSLLPADGEEPSGADGEEPSGTAGAATASRRRLIAELEHRLRVEATA